MRACDRRRPPHEELSERWINDTCTITRARRESRDHGQTQTRSYGERREASEVATVRFHRDGRQSSCSGCLRSREHSP